VFKDEGRETNHEASSSNQTPVSIPDQQYSEDQKTNSMGVIDEVDSVDFSSTMKSS
jgi:hypothetical protein